MPLSFTKVTEDDETLMEGGGWEKRSKFRRQKVILSVLSFPCLSCMSPVLVCPLYVLVCPLQFGSLETLIEPAMVDTVSDEKLSLEWRYCIQKHIGQPLSAYEMV